MLADEVGFEVFNHKSVQAVRLDTNVIVLFSSVASILGSSAVLITEITSDHVSSANLEV